MCYRLVRYLVLALKVPCRQGFSGSQPVVLGPRYRRCAGCTSTYGAHSLPSRRGEGGRGSRVRLPGLLYFRQLLFCRLVDEVDGTPACNPAKPPPVETTRPHVMIQHRNYSTRRLIERLPVRSAGRFATSRFASALRRVQPRAAALMARPASRSWSRSMMARRLS